MLKSSQKMTFTQCSSSCNLLGIKQHSLSVAGLKHKRKTILSTIQNSSMTTVCENNQSFPNPSKYHKHIYLIFLSINFTARQLIHIQISVLISTTDCHWIIYIRICLKINPQNCVLCHSDNLKFLTEPTISTTNDHWFINISSYFCF